MFVKAVSPPSFFLLPSPFLDAFTAHICRLHTHINICFAHIECHCKSRGVKTTRRQSVGPAQQQATQPAHDVAVDDEAEAPSQMKGSLFSVVLLAHSANAPAPKVLKMDKITIYKRPTKLCTNSLPILWFWTPHHGESTPVPPRIQKCPSLHTSECPP